MARVMLVDDDDRGRRALGRLLQLGGHDVSALGRVASLGTPLQEYQVAVVDGGHAEGAGTEWIRCLTERGERLPCILYTGSADEGVRVAALDAGAWSCVGKPFVRELMSSIAGVLRRTVSAGPAASTGGAEWGGLAVEGETGVLLLKGRPLRLGGTLLRILRVLVAARGEVVPADALLRGGIGRSATTSLREHIRRLRAELDAASRGSGAQIESVYGRGYRLAARRGRRSRC